MSKRMAFPNLNKRPWIVEKAQGPRRDSPFLRGLLLRKRAHIFLLYSYFCLPTYRNRRKEQVNKRREKAYGPLTSAQSIRFIFHRVVVKPRRPGPFVRLSPEMNVQGRGRRSTVVISEWGRISSVRENHFSPYRISRISSVCSVSGEFDTTAHYLATSILFPAIYDCCIILCRYQ
jgi:hypothetical protein